MKARVERKRMLVIVGLALVLLVAGATWVWAQTEDGPIYACVNPHDGTLYIVADPAECKKNETLLTWNILGPKGDPGLACWDLDGDGAADTEEDANGDAVVDVLDCKGPAGEPGTAGADGADGLACWDLDGDGVGDPDEDTNSDAVVDVLDCKGPAGVVERPGFSLSVVDSVNVGSGWSPIASITIGADGLPVIAYQQGGGGRGDECLKAAHCNDLACTSAVVSTLHSGGYTIASPSITIGPDGLPVIGYGETWSWMARCRDVACTSADVKQLNYTSSTPPSRSIALGADGLLIASSNQGTRLLVEHCDNAACDTYSSALLDYSAGCLKSYTSIAIGVDGLPVISYHRHESPLFGTSPIDLRVAHCNDPACATATFATLDGTGDVGDHTSLAIGVDGLPVISYYDNTNGTLKVARCSDVACSGGTFTTVDSALASATSIVIGADGLPVISYRGASGLRVAHCSDLACSGAVLTTVDSAAGAGLFSSLTIGVDGLPVISYYDLACNVKVAHCSNVFCTPFVRTR